MSLMRVSFGPTCKIKGSGGPAREVHGLSTAKTLELQGKPMYGDGQQNRIKNKLPKIIHRIRLDMDALY